MVYSKRAYKVLSAITIKINSFYPKLNILKQLNLILISKWFIKSVEWNMHGAPYSHLYVIKQYFLTQNKHFQKIYVKLRFFKNEFKKSGQFTNWEWYILYFQNSKKQAKKIRMNTWALHGISEINGFWMPISNFVNNGYW